MKNQRFNEYIYWGATALAVVACSLALSFVLSRFGIVAGAVRKLMGILMPIIYGAVLAYLLLPVYNRIFFKVRDGLPAVIKSGKTRRSFAKFAATIVSLTLLFAVVLGLFWLIIPQIYDSVMGFQASLGDYINNLTEWLTKLLEDNPHLEEVVMPYYREAVLRFQNWISTYLVPNMSMILNRLSTGLLNVVTFVKNVLIGVIVMVYILNIKDILCAQGKKVMYGLLPVKKANLIVSEIRFIHRVFGGFITGKLLDSLIIGILCFFCIQFLKMPYVLLISVIIGVTNVIPFFGPFIGAIPSAFLILLVSPMKCLYFIIFILLLQQFDGNILGPKILGSSTGLPSFWVLFSILLFGGLFGFVGMIIAVPTFAVFYRAFSIYVNRRLAKKELSERTEDYMNLHRIDEKEKTYEEQRAE